MPRLSSYAPGFFASTLLVACGTNGGGGTTAAAGSTGGTGSTGAAATTPGSTSADPSASGTSGSGSASMTGTTTSAATTSPTTTASTSTSTSTATTGPIEGTSSDTGVDTTTGGGAQVVHFVAIGDTGEGNENQYMVGQAIAQLCAQKGCDFGLLLGDNFYDSGVSSVNDPQFQDKFELPYEDLDFPIYVALGNHDYGGNGIGVDFDTKKAQYQVDYTKMSQTWKLPAKFYSFKLEHAEFWGLDTNQVMTDPINGNSDPQKTWLKNGVAASQATWKIAFGHHPYLSNGDHGNAGDYENLEGIPLGFFNGANVKTFMDEAICGKVDIYISGHDHNLQWLEPTCGTEFIVSGGGSKSENLPGVNPAYFGMPLTEGFLWGELKDSSFTGVFYDKTGKELYSKTLNK
jgi:tartrate-resistant acid phosphatase type 5